MQAKNSVQCSGRQPAAVSPRFWEVGEYGFVIDELLSFLRAVLSTEHVPFELHHAGATKYASPNTLIVHGLNSLDYYFHGMQDFMSIVMPGYAYSPLLRLFQASFQQHPWLRHCSFRNPSLSLSVVPLLEAEVFNDFVQVLRTRARLQDTSLHMRRWKSDTERSQAASIAEYVPKLLSGGDRLEPIRVDFQYQESVFALADALPYGRWVADTSQWVYVSVQSDCREGKPESRARIDARVAMHDRARFFANIYRDVDKQTFQYMRGYISKMERGVRGANHFHCCFFLDADRPARVTTSAVIDVICRRWLRATQGRGLVFSCHSPDYQQQLKRQGRWALDTLAGHNERQVTRLTDYLVSYFARDKDQSIHVKPAARSRALTMAVGRGTVKRSC
ncbi:inovirus Gp2 family protein [Burkholderia stagnalis]|uniref:inovirus-type Gp2 protein n=1 Tax=Burkholderia stagnalis TaxID=1503054 RepID=UPI000F5B492E|nr:inovirus-type Gp2 protein [Burkholderia stagnalis]RQQ24586.1 inovirus Gp2 family protein [Burkholderia stagnalis]RQY48015.1 inovirus Gp2 family protein [Burkholderia stagnalis]